MARQQTEALKKYLAGLFDADGSISFHFYKLVDGGYRAGLKWSLMTTSSIDRNFKTLHMLHEAFPYGSICYPDRRKEAWEPVALWQIQHKGELEKFIPHIAKYAYIKGGHLMRMLEKRREISGRSLSEAEVKALKVWAKQSRRDTRPLKSKNYPSAAWLAGITDGDGSLICKYQPKKKYMRMRYTIAEADNDVTALEFIQRAFGGEIRLHGSSSTATVKRLELNLGHSNTAKTRKFLHYILPHLRMKKHAAEQILAQHKQRLSERTPTGEATV